MSNWYPRYYGDYMRDTGHLSLIEHGVYTVLLDHYYATKNGLPDGDDAIYRLCRAFTDQERAAVDSVCRQFFAVNGDGKRHNRRADAEILKEIAISQSRSEAGSKRWEGRNKSIASAKQVLSKPHANDTTSTSTSTNTPTTTTIEPPQPPKGGSDRKPRSYDQDFEEAWTAFGRYGAKPKAAAYWRKLPSEDRVSVMATIPKYLDCVAAGRAKKQFEGWINPENRLWEMDWATVLTELTRPIPARTTDRQSWLPTGTGGL